MTAGTEIASKVVALGSGLTRSHAEMDLQDQISKLIHIKRTVLSCVSYQLCSTTKWKILISFEFFCIQLGKSLGKVFTRAHLRDSKEAGHHIHH